MKYEHPLSQQEFDDIYSKVPRLTVEVILNSETGVLLTKRAIEPCKGKWHLPGGTVRFGEPLFNAVSRIAARELGIVVSKTKLVGVIEYPSHYENGIDHPVGVAYEVTEFRGEMAINQESSEKGWFKTPPEHLHEQQDEFLINHGYLKN